MTKKIILLTIGFYSLILITSLFQSCTPLKGSICNIWFDYAYQVTDVERKEKGAIYFDLTANDNCQSAFLNFKFFSLV